MFAVYDIAHLLAGLMLVAGFAMLYQDRISSVLSTFAVQAMLLAIAVAWQAVGQNRPHLFITALLALLLKGIVIPYALKRMMSQLGMQRDVEQVVGAAKSIMLALALTALSFMLVLRVTAKADMFTREGLAISLAVILTGLLMMIVRRNAVTQIVGFMSIENGLILAATGARGMPLVVEVSVAFSVLIALFVFGVFVFHMRERFESVDINALEKVRGELP